MSVSRERTKWLAENHPTITDERDNPLSRGSAIEQRFGRMRGLSGRRLEEAVSDIVSARSRKDNSNQNKERRLQAVRNTEPAHNLETKANSRTAQKIVAEPVSANEGVAMTRVAQIDMVVGGERGVGGVSGG